VFVGEHTGAQKKLLTRLENGRSCDQIGSQTSRKEIARRTGAQNAKANHREKPSVSIHEPIQDRFWIVTKGEDLRGRKGTEARCPEKREDQRPGTGVPQS